MRIWTTHEDVEEYLPFGGFITVQKIDWNRSSNFRNMQVLLIASLA